MLLGFTIVGYILVSSLLFLEWTWRWPTRDRTVLCSLMFLWSLLIFLNLFIVPKTEKGGYDVVPGTATPQHPRTLLWGT